MTDTSATPALSPPLSVIIPARNAEATIAAVLDSVLSQDYPGPLEVIVADGSDTPATAGIVRRHYPSVRLLRNPQQTTPCGLNIAIREANGAVIVRCDAHAILKPGYLQRAVKTMQRTGAANVGGRQEPVGTSFFERGVALAMTTFLGAGDSRYRLGGGEGPVDTVYLGVFRSDALDAVGGYDPTLVRNQDYELNWRLRARGETVWFDPALATFYRPRGTLRSLARQYFDYGSWKRVVLARHPSSLRVRHLIAPLFIVGLVASLLLLLTSAPWQAAAALPLLYLVTLLFGSLAVGLNRRAPAALLLPLLLATMHLSWGLGFFLPPRRQTATFPRHAGAEIGDAPPRPGFAKQRAAVVTAADYPAVSVIIPARNAEATIAEALDSVLAQQYPGAVEIVVADGSDTPATAEILRRHYPSVRLVPNPQRVIGFGIEAAIRASTGEILVRCDAHTILRPGYLQRAVDTLQRTGAANVGGRQEPVGSTFFERGVALAMTSFLGSGGARYRLGGGEGPAETVYLGVFRRVALDAVGGYDPVLIRGEDYELNWRLRTSGATVWFDPALAVDYRPRSTLRSLASQYFDYGRWKRVVLARHPSSLLARHLAAPLLILGLVASLLLLLTAAPWQVVAAFPLLYLLALLLGSLTIGLRRRAPAALLLPLLLATMHLSWGLGFFLPPRQYAGGGGGGDAPPAASGRAGKMVDCNVIARAPDAE